MIESISEENNYHKQEQLFSPIKELYSVFKDKLEKI